MKWPLYGGNFSKNLRMKQTKMDLWNIAVGAGLCPTDAKYLAREECHS